MWLRILARLSNFSFIFHIEFKQLLLIFLKHLIHMLGIVQFIIQYILKTKYIQKVKQLEILGFLYSSRCSNKYRFPLIR